MRSGRLTDALQQTLAIFETDGHEPLTTSEVATELDLGRRSTYDRLERLADRGDLATKEVGARGRVWWVPRQETDGPASDSPTAVGVKPDHDLAVKSFETLVDAVEDYAIFLLDPQGRVATWNAGARQSKGYERSEILGEPVARFYTDADTVARVPERNLAAAARDGTMTDSGWRVRKDGTEFWASVTITALRDEEGTLRGFAKVTRDQTERRKSEYRLRRQHDEVTSELETVLDRVDDGFVAVDEDWQFTYVTDRASEMLGLPTAELLGSTVWTVLPEIATGRVREFAETAMERQESGSIDFYSELLDRWFEIRAFPDDTGLSVYFRDVSDRKERELELERYEAIVETVDDGIYATRDSHFTMVNQQYAEMTGYDRDELLGSHVEMLVDDETIERATALDEALRSGEAETGRLEADLQCADGDTLRTEATFTLLGGDAVPDSGVDAATPDGGADTGSATSVDTAKHPAEDDGADDGRERVGVVRDVTERHERERTLERRRERLAALDDLNAVVREITTGVIEQSTREEMEETVCEGLAAADSYRFAWIGEVDGNSQHVRLRTEAGVEDYLDGVTITVDPDDPHSQGPTGRAFYTESVQTSRDALAEPRFEPWEEIPERYEFRSSAAVPIVHEESIYGVLNVYADRPHAFEGQELDVIGQLGAVLGHAIAALDRKRALMSDEVVEIDFRLTDVRETLGIDGPEDEHVSLGRTVSIGDGEFLVYGTANESGVEFLRDVVSTLPHWRGLDVLDETGDEVRIQAHLAEPPVLAAIASHGGSIDEFLIEDDEIYMRIHLAPSSEVREVVDVVHERYPTAEMLSRQQIDRPEDGSEQLHQTIAAALTERQQVALETAYNMGFFERPRVQSGAEIAATLGISTATLHQHLRKAEQQIVEIALDR